MHDTLAQTGSNDAHLKQGQTSESVDLMIPDVPDRPREACGVFGIFASGEDVARITYFGLYALQHRGQESAGIATADGATLFAHRQMGLVAQAFTEADLAELRGFAAIGHTRYSTAGSSRIENAQPVMVEGPLGPLALAHNGNLTNSLTLRRRVLESGEQLRGTSDTELVAHLLVAAPGETYVQKLQHVMPQLEGAYSLVLLTPTQLLGVRDPNGVRPLSLGRLHDHWVLASETCALETVGATPVRDVAPGEIVVVESEGGDTDDKVALHSYVGQRSTRSAACLFEYIYFARPDSTINDRSLYLARQRMGARLAQEFPVAADLVIGVPDSATPAAAGYAAARKLPYAEGLIKNRYIGRTFIQPDQRLRQLGVKMKFNALGAVLEGKRVVMIDDSIVRGTTVRPLVKLLRDAGAREVHLGVTSPPFRYPCYLGLDVARRSELIAARLPDTEAIAREIGVDSLCYLSLEGLIEAIDLPAETFCNGCFTGAYPVPVDMEQNDKFALEVAAGLAAGSTPQENTKRNEPVGTASE
ncbi:MAG TPA: amidophosphoribosyltransferase [Ktedonobacterales bacterium]